jgi:hypothetical protein
MMRWTRRSSLAAAALLAGLRTAVAPAPEPAQASQAAAPQPGSFLLTVFLRHDQTKTVDQINEHLRQTGWYDKFPPDVSKSSPGM